MKCLSVRQPWADLICPPDDGIEWLRLPRGLELPKDVENRRWYTTYRGDLLIHVSQIVDWEAVEMFGLTFRDFVVGAIVGKVILVGCGQTARGPVSAWAMAGQYHWRLQYPERFERAVGWKGTLGLFDVPEGALGVESFRARAVEPSFV